jgi:tRNA G37 N-methylase TrmD
MQNICKDSMKIYLSSKFSNIEEAKVWLSEWANNDHQIVQDGKYEGITFSVNLMIMHISIALGDDVDNAFKSIYYWKLRDYYEDNIFLHD